MEQLGLVLYLSKFTDLWVNIFKLQDNMLTLEQIRKNPHGNAYSIFGRTWLLGKLTFVLSSM